MIHNSFFGILHSEVIASYTLVLLVILLILQNITIQKKHSLAFSTIDIAIAFFAIYITVHAITTDNIGIDTADICKWGAVLASYILIRRLSNKRVIFHILVIFGVIEALTAIGQKINILESEHIRFDVTGHLGNPGPLGGYLGICLIVTFFLIREAYQSRRRKLFIYLVTSAILLSIGLALADSRAAILGTLGGGLFLLPLHRLMAKLIHKKALLLASLFIITTFATLLYVYRPQSVKARLLIAKVSIEMVAEHPLFGFGIGTFEKKYMIYQSRHFEKNNHTEDSMVADNTNYAYNELIHLTVETGFIGSFIVLCIIGTIYLNNPISTDLNTRIAKAGATAWLIFAMFSYPANILPLLLTLPLLLGCIQSDKYKLSFDTRWIYISLSFVFLWIGIWSFQQGLFYQKASLNLCNFSQKNNICSLKYLERHYSLLKQNIKFNMIYHRQMAKYSYNKANLMQIKEIIPTSESYCWLGDYYYRIGMRKEAEKTYQIASFMVPTRLRPNYKLWRLYTEAGDSINSVKIARKLLTQPLKVENSFTINVKSEIRTYLQRKDSILK